MDARCHAAAKLRGEDPSEGTGRKLDLWCAVSLQPWRVLNAQGNEFFIVFICPQDSVSHLSYHWGRKKSHLTVLY